MLFGLIEIYLLESLCRHCLLYLLFYRLFYTIILVSVHHIFNFSDTLRSEYYLTENFCKYHFLVGLLLQQVKLSLNELSIMRKIAITTLRDLLAKHELDDRYRDKVRISIYSGLIITCLYNNII
jgi:hypothetical protein